MPRTLKSKGSVRVKSGCHTCRIRRKKCDEQRDSEGSCETCIRLHIQCLGFGGRRPPWLQDRRNVKRTCDKIKAFLATQGLIKGHSACGRCVALDDTLFLRLDDDTTPSSSESPPTSELSLGPYSPPYGSVFDERDEGQHQQWVDDTYEQSSSRFSFRSSSQDCSRSQVNYSSTGDSSIPTPSSLIQSHGLLASFPITASHSNWPSFNSRFLSENSSSLFFALPPQCFGDDALTYYICHVMGIQYVFANRIHIRATLEPAVLTSGFAQKAALLLAAIHRQRVACHIPGHRALQSGDTNDQYLKLRQSLLSGRVGRHSASLLNKDGALAAIIIISSVLFDGGQGDWSEWLDWTYNYATAKVFSCDFDARAALRRADDLSLFIVKNGIWFDVLGSVTSGQSPRFLDYIRLLYSPTRSRLQSLDASEDDSFDRLSMLTTMGAEDLTVLALAEAIALYQWKSLQIEQGSLDAKELVKTATSIEQYLDASVSTSLTAQNSGTHALGAQLFRGATRVYLRSVVSGDFPGVGSIREAIDETMSTARQLSLQELNSSSVIRSTVFAFFICGALSDDPTIRREVKEALSLTGENPNNANVGNSPSIRRLLQEIWDQRRTSRDPVQWRQRLKSFNLLLV